MEQEESCHILHKDIACEIHIVTNNEGMGRVPIESRCWASKTMVRKDMLMHDWELLPLMFP
jgi:hypothetical protein